MFTQTSTRVPASPQEFWGAIREQFGFVEAVLDLPLETYDDAIACRYRLKELGDNGEGLRVGYREDRWRKHFHEEANALLPGVREAIESKQLTWESIHSMLTLFQMASYLMPFALDASDPLAQARGGGREVNTHVTSGWHA